MDNQTKAKNLVGIYIESHTEVGEELPLFEIFVVWYSKTLKNWKCLVSTTLPDGMYYEVTYNGEKFETYIDAYKKFNNVCIKDSDISPALNMGNQI